MSRKIRSTLIYSVPILSLIIFLAGCYPKGPEYYSDLDLTATDYDPEYKFGDQKYYFDLTAFPLKDAQGNTVQVAELVKDVTREVNLQAELLQHERKDMIVKMASQIAHEIRNPLGALTLNIDLLEDEIANLANSTEVGSLLATIKQELDGLNRVLQEYLECARFPQINQSKIMDGLFQHTLNPECLDLVE